MSTYSTWIFIAVLPKSINQSLSQIGQGVRKLWSDIQTNTKAPKQRLLPYIITYKYKWTICVLLFRLLLLCLYIRIIVDGNHINIDLRTSSPNPYLPPSFHFNTQKGTVYVSVDTDAVPIIDLRLELYSTTGILLLNHPKKKIFLWIKEGHEGPTLLLSFSFLFSCLICNFLFPSLIKTFYPGLIEEMWVLLGY